MILLGNNVINTIKAGISGQFVWLDGEKFYQIHNYQEMPDFFISIVSDSDHWMYISSNGSLSAGRKDRDHAFFPYYTDDKIHDYRGKTGSRTYFLVKKSGKTFLWEPFTEASQQAYRITRNLYKSIYGNKIIFEEVNADLDLSFRYGWYNSDKFGFVKKSSIINQSKTNTAIEVLDGIKNILPHGIDYAFQNEYSNLLDAYKKSELVENTTLALFRLSSIPVDRAEPSEALKVTTVWSAGLEGSCKILISDKQVNKFTEGLPVVPEYDARACRGAYFINSRLELKGNAGREWFTIGEIGQDNTDVSNLNHIILSTDHIEALILADIDLGTLNLKKMVSFADGFQMTNTEMCYARHYSNTLYNIMRGGIFINNYLVDVQDYKNYLWQINRLVSKESHQWLAELPDNISFINLIDSAEQNGDPDLIRITYEYLPLIFSRRHGDPSRPWNLFSIETKNESGQLKYNYQGNWRDIFQNWEALCLSYPEFVESVICKFVNASNIDGYNPYRIMREGIDWECPEPDDPWSFIGYWGDHQIIYLQKLLEISDNFHPGKLDILLISEIFAYANVPYRIKSYDEILRNPKNTIVFDKELNGKIKSEAEHLGADARLLKSKENDRIYRVNLTEKILVSLLSKLINFIPGAGIWMNTQRPEWNDANNALVGNGTSMVTLYYLRRALKFWADKFSRISMAQISVSEEVAALFDSVHSFYKDNAFLIDQGFTDPDRKNFTDFLGQAHWKYRAKIYNYSFSGEKTFLRVKDLLAFCRLCLRHIDHSIRLNKRDDGLYHAYNLISLSDDKISIRHLYEMLEGQVAVLSSGFLSTRESLDVLNSLKKSKMFRPDQYSYMLYPDRQLARFIDKNIIPGKFVMESALFKKLLEDNETSVIKEDNEGRYHFNGAFRNAEGLETALDKLRYRGYSHLIEDEKEKILAIFEEIFDHQSFTGRSGTFYGYEGLGSIYWHMVSKLLLATQECYFSAIEDGSDVTTISQLKDHYYEIKAGIGLYKPPDLYGAFPMDAYSHTPSGSGVKQPGLTGQVKEDIISRQAELGIQIKNGEIIFNTSLINQGEIFLDDAVFEYFTLEGSLRKIPLKQKQLALTFCQVPIVYTESEEDKIIVTYKNGEDVNIPGNRLSREISARLFKRTGTIEQIDVFTNDFKNHIKC